MSCLWTSVKNTMCGSNCHRIRIQARSSVLGCGRWFVNFGLQFCGLLADLLQREQNQRMRLNKGAARAKLALAKVIICNIMFPQDIELWLSTLQRVLITCRMTYVCSRNSQFDQVKCSLDTIPCWLQHLVTSIQIGHDTGRAWLHHFMRWKFLYVGVPATDCIWN